MRWKGIVTILSVVSLAAASEELRPRPPIGLTWNIGNGEAFGGGDPRYERLNAARERLNGALSAIQRGYQVSTLCRISSCGSGDNPDLCHSLASLNVRQVEECQTFLVSHAAELERLNSPRVTPLNLSPGPLVVYEGGSTPRSVSALTRRERNGAIVFHYESVASTSLAGLIALLAHELSHKVPLVSAGYLTDDGRFGSFSRGRQFLDAVGAALSLYSSENLLPAQAAPEFPIAMGLGDACALARDIDSRFILGLIADIEGQMPSSVRVSEMRRRVATSRELRTIRQALSHETLSSERGRAETVRAVFVELLGRAPLDEEVALFRDRLREGDDYDSISASIAAGPEFNFSHGGQPSHERLAAVYRQFTGRPPTPSELGEENGLLARMDYASWVLRLIKRHPDALAQRVNGWYRQYLNRWASPEELSIQTARLKAGLGWDEVRLSVLASGEYAALQVKRWGRCDIAQRPVVPPRS